MDEHDINGARAIVPYLCRSGLKWYRRVPRPYDWDTTYGSIRKGYRIYEAPEQVESTLLRGEGSVGIGRGNKSNRYILLAPPGDEWVVCLLGAYWDLSTAPIKLTLNLHLFGRSQLPNVLTWHRGYRLELPHRNQSHDYPHVQPVRAEGWPTRAPVPFADMGVPDKFPAFPLRGSNLTTLCATLEIALRGRTRATAYKITVPSISYLGSRRSMLP